MEWYVLSEKGSKAVYVTDGSMELRVIDIQITKQDRIRCAEAIAFRLNAFDGLVERIRDLESTVHHGNTF